MTTSASLTIEQSRAENARVAQGLRRKDPQLLDQLIVQYQHRLLRYLLYLTSNREVAEDMFQETWMRVLVRGSQYKGEARFDTWLYTIARNLVIDMRRKRTMLSLEELCEEATRTAAWTSQRRSYSLRELPALRKRRTPGHALLTLDTLHREVWCSASTKSCPWKKLQSDQRSPLDSEIKTVSRPGCSEAPHESYPG